MLDYIAQNFIAAFISVIATVLATFLTRKVGHVLDAIEAKAGIEFDEKVQERANDIVRQVVGAVSQSFVSDLKKDGKFDMENKGQALVMAMSRSRDMILRELGIVKSDDELRIAVEAEVELHKAVGG
jgi:hypothetical protein